MVKPRGRGELVLKTGKPKLKPKAQILVFPEGFTERIYLMHLDHRKHNLEIIIPDIIHTDAYHIVLDAVRFLRDNRIEPEYGDRVYCMFDADKGSNPIELLQEAVQAARQNDIHLIFSNPSIEVWFYLHYADPPRIPNGREMKKRLRRDCIRDYHETLDIYNRLLPLQPAARQRAARLHARQSAAHRELIAHESRPYTNIHLFLDYLDSVEAKVN